eukprot:gene14033-biopygen8702
MMQLGASDFPSLDGRAPVPLMNIPIPDYAERRAAMAADPTACVMAYQTMNRAIFVELWGMRMCGRCPDCDCRDPEGFVCEVNGGINGHALGLNGSNEHQNCQDEHGHFQVYIAWPPDAMRRVADPATRAALRDAIIARYSR